MKVSQLTLRYLLEFCWESANVIFRVVQRFVWLFTGTHRRLSAARRPENYNRSAQVMVIRYRFKFDEYLYGAKATDFMLTHERFEAPEYVLQNHITLYQVSN